VTKHEGFSDRDATAFQYSQTGEFVAVKKKGVVDIRNAETGEVVRSVGAEGATHFYLSPQGTYLLTFSPLRKGEETDGNLVAVEVKSGDTVGKFVQKSLPEDSWPSVKWTEDEVIAARRVTNELHFWTGSNLTGAPIKKLRCERVADFSLSPGSLSSFQVGVFLESRKGSPAEVRLYQYPTMRQLCAKNFYADSVQFRWSPSGKQLLAAVTADVDRTGRSYYGSSGLYMLSQKFDCMVDMSTKKEGSVHDSTWHPDGEQFVVIYGFMPPNSTVLDLKCDPVADFGAAHRNMCKYSPDGRILWLAGLGGGLRGEMDFWNARSLNKLGSAEASSSATHSEWSPDSLHVLTAILSPRMRVDNCFTIWSYQGLPIYREEFKELLQVTFRPMKCSSFYQPRLRKAPAPKPDDQSGPKPAAKPAKYRHPNHSGAASSIDKPATDAKPKKYRAPGTAGSGNAPSIPGMTAAPNNNKNRKRRNKKRGNQQNIPGL